MAMASNKTLKKMKYALRFLPDEAYIQLYYFAQCKKFCNLTNPRTFNEKLNWLKLHDRNPLYTTMVDKYEAKKYVSEIIGNEYCIPTYGVWDTFDDINFDILPNQFVLKCTHDSEGVVIVKDKSELDYDAAKEKLMTALSQNFYYIGREWPYKNVKPRIIAEEYIEETKSDYLRDYKFFCFNGEAKVFYVTSNRGLTGGLRIDYFDLDWNHLDITHHKYPQNKNEILERPENFQEMLYLAEQLSDGLPFVRVDLYSIGNKIYFGELTLYPDAGFNELTPDKWNYTFGDWLKLPNLHET